jgi:seryl-tRNA synthetase
MLEIQRLRNQPAAVAAALQKKGLAQAEAQIASLLALDESRRKALTALEQLRADMNAAAKSVGQLMREGRQAEAEAAKAASAQAKDAIRDLEQQVAGLDEESRALLVSLPNAPHESVPPGRSAADNFVAFRNERQVSFDFSPLPHWELARKHDIIDWELGVKLTGAGFPVYKGAGAALQRALITFFLDRAVAAGYTEIQPPLVVNADSGFATGQLPDKEGQMYFIQEDNLYLIPTAEVPITNLYRDEILEEQALPVKNCGYTPCFRREAGSYGKDVKGLNRLHQFDKVELVQIAHPDRSYEVLEEMTAHVEGLLEALELPFRRLLLCGGDMSFASAKTYDLEVWSAAQERWLEVSSVSNFETFQANRLKLRFRSAAKQTQLVHTLNGSALALPRIVASLLENHQQADGSIRIPEALQPYFRAERIG